MMYQKLVRDNIPAIVEKNGETCVTRTLPRSGALWTARKRWRM